MIFFMGLFLIGCTSNATNIDSNTDCASITDIQKRDICYGEGIKDMPPSEIDALIANAEKMVDPMIRGAAIAEWIKNHNNEINKDKGQKLCTLLDGRDRSYCMRRLSSPHLKR